MYFIICIVFCGVFVPEICILYCTFFGLYIYIESHVLSSCVISLLKKIKLTYLLTYILTLLRRYCGLFDVGII